MTTNPALRILVVDDNPDIARGTVRLLEQAGFATAAAGTAAEALQAVRSHLPHIVLLDRQLPDLDGLEVCQRIKADPATAWMFVVIASAAHVSGADQLVGLETGADGYITRPIGNRELLARIEAFARIVRLHQKLADEVAQRRLLEAELDERVRRRTDELTSANQKLEAARRAAVNLMQDATATQRHLASVNEQLACEIAERSQAEEKLKAAYTKLELLWGVASLADADTKTLADHILVGITRLSASQYGFYGFVNEDESIMTIHSWSGGAMQDCAMVSQPTEFPVCRAGVWAEAIRRREPLLLNDYSAAHAGKRGLPAGHVALTKLLVVPHFSHGRIVAVAAVANRATDYGPDDVREIQAFLVSVQAVVDRQQAEAALLGSERLFRREFYHAKIGRCMVGLDKRFLRVNHAFCALLGYTDADLTSLTFPEVTHPDDRAASREGVAQLLAGTASYLDLQKRYLTKTGQTVWGAVHVVLERDADGQPQHFSVHIQDITARKQAEAALLASETLLNSSQRLSKIGGWEWVISSRTMTWTQETYRLHDLLPDACGPSSAKLIELSAACYAPEDRRLVLEAFQRCVEQGQPYDLECSFTTTAGRTLWVRTTAEAIWDGPRIVRVVGNLMDITERKQYELALRASEERLARAQQAAGAGLWDWNIADGITVWSPELFRLFGLDPETAVAGFDAWLGIVHPEDREIAEKRISSAVCDHVRLESDYRIVRPSGQICWISASGDTTYDASGRPLRMSGICLDVTRRKLAEAEAQANHQRMLSILDANPDLVYVSDPQTYEVLYANRALVESLGTPAGRKCHEFLQHRATPCPFCTNHLILGDNYGKTHLWEFQNEANRHWYRCLDRAITWPDGRIVRYEVATDITDLKHAESALLKSLREKESLLKEIHHRVKNNLQVITSLLRLQSNKIANSAAETILLDMQNRVRSMALIHEHLYRSENLAEVDLAAYLRQLCQQLFRAMSPAPGTIHLRLETVPIRLGIDQAIPCGLLVNEMFSNALKHAFPNGRTGEIQVQLQFTAADSTLRLRVADNGVGLPTGLDPKQLNSLGLQLISDLTRQLRGRLEIGPGPGTSFAVVFRIVSPA